jgi:hypothetical protein
MKSPLSNGARGIQSSVGMDEGHPSEVLESLDIITMNGAAAKRTVYRISPLRLWLVPMILIVVAVFMLMLASSSTGTPDTRKLAN